MGETAGSGGGMMVVPSSEPGSRRSGNRSDKSSSKVFRNSSMTRNPQERRTPEQIRASNRRLGLVLLAIAAVFFTAVIINQGWFS
ncbi:hypothetical protein QFZ39_000751 [Paraburkholderia graminis]|nr:hypothetical protein [Paraburkholderia graminis]